MASTISLASAAGSAARPVHLVTSEACATLLAGLPPAERRFAEAQGFKGESGKLVLLPDGEGDVARVLFGLGSGSARDASPLAPGKLAVLLPPGTYRFEGDFDRPELAVLAVLLGGYRFDRYRKANGHGGVKFVCPEGVDPEALDRTAEAIFLTRDLINTPANDLGTAELVEAARQVADRFGATFSVIEGQELETGFPMVHAVGDSSERRPRLIDCRWGDETAPRVTLVGKGVVFDTGGVDIKSASGMLLMKKDMGGAANVLGLASMIMGAGLKVRLRVLIPTVENAVSDRSFRPGDILRSRKGFTVEIGNTDAEGRLILADALAYADEEKPEILISMATLTGAARVALGPEVVPFFSDDEAFAQGLQQAADDLRDPLWRLPLWRPYDSWLASRTADMNNVSTNGHAGAIVAALFLDRFVENARTYAHFDVFGWNPGVRPACPEGGEAQAIRALFAHLSASYG
ncbi:leucyl aminopeptidase [Faunimonas pinastri]|uniref:Leucyl aminopeptidase n=1 Tax=Faunimonas pinastri TaxID=1855383 RepID=A0A1H9HHA3_9HYPH|nr:leucyl aminopeptidase family protein [Faunimonas pinastri]SEQ61606.1 leucyl aminopeptidase [Faunimonas pinastri]